MAWEIIDRLEDKIAIWRNREELRGKPYAVGPLGPAGWIEPVAGQFEFLSEARAAARERLHRGCGPTEDREYKTPDISPSELASLIERLFTTSTDNIPAILDEYKPDELRLILSALGVSARGARSRVDLVHRIVTEITVRRTLSGLRDGATP